MTEMFPLPVWIQGTTQPSTPVNDSFLRAEVLARGATSILSTPPGSPADGDVHIVGASPTGAWSTFAVNDVVLWRSGTWYRFAPFFGWLKQVGSDVRRFDGAAWVVVTGGGGGGAVPVQDEGTTVVASPTAINFVGAGVNVTNSGGVATVDVPGGGGGGGLSLESVVWTASAIPGAGFNVISTVGIGTDLTGSRFTQALSPTSRYRSDARVAISQNTVAGWGTNAGFSRGSGGGGGYKGRMIFAPNEGATRAGHRLFIGTRPFVTPSDVDPSTLTNIFGIGYDSADTQVQLFHNDAVGTATKVALGASFPKPTANEAVIYDLVITCLPSASSVSYLLTERISGATASGSISSDIAASGVSLDFAAYMSQGGGGAVPIQLDIFGAYFQLRPTA